ncbi:hypothetical protein Pmani_001112 [Petrolisthes manimaculis]|uniref:Uncharacterized protein n=1 Tax=Petrolisthes manimaculis TaxID=1843537 RepID=A0AAE1QMW8_9EUCA|nr:hypothetical protein Pmani_001112 [Petrolisthes manimaculis]
MAPHTGSATASADDARVCNANPASIRPTKGGVGGSCGGRPTAGGHKVHFPPPPPPLPPPTRVRCRGLLSTITGSEESAETFVFVRV